MLISKELKQSVNLDDFIERMKEKDIKVFKGRGISFIDDKKMKVKGSEIGFSLQKIQKKLDHSLTDYLQEKNIKQRKTY